MTSCLFLIARKTFAFSFSTAADRQRLEAVIRRGVRSGLCDLKPGFHSNAIACVGKQPIMVATASTEHSYWLALAFVAWMIFCLPTQALAFLAVFVYATHATQVIAF